MNSIKVGKYTIEITHQDKKWFPDGITKLDVVEYYNKIAPVMVPYMQDRPLNMLRFPDGITGEQFYQKETPDYFPSWIKRFVVQKEGGVVHQVVCNIPATLVYLANQACITPHIWLSRIDKIHYPDTLIFDLDPSGRNFSLIRDVALRIKQALEDKGLVPFVKTTGSRGLHVVTPIKRTLTFDKVRAFARSISEDLIADDPKNLTLEMNKAKRGTKIFMDTMRNSYGATAVSPYAVRSHDGAPVATPIFWEEVHDKKLTSQRYNINNVFKKLKADGDAWKDMAKHARKIPTS